MSRRQILPTLYFSILLIIGFSTPAWFWYTTLQIRPGLGPDPASIASRICWFIQTKVSVWLFISSWDPLIALVVALLTSMPKKFVQAFKLACWFSYFTVTYKFVEELIVKPYTERAGMKTFDVIVAATQFAMDFVLFNEVVLFVVSERYRMVILFVNGAMRDTTVEELEHAATILEKAGSDGLAAKFGAFFGQGQSPLELTGLLAQASFSFS